MSLIQAIILGLVQGLTEFLPISSTAHLTLAGRAMGLIDQSASEHWTAFIAVIQLGTLLAVLAYFRRDIVAIVSAFFKDLPRIGTPAQMSPEGRTGLYIILGTIPIVVIGLAFKGVIEGPLTKNLNVIGISLIVLALLLELAERVATFQRPIESANAKDALLIGAAQSLALIPGASRSGTTITAGLFAGFTREAAARFSFLLSIPAVASSGLLKLYQELPHLDSTNLIATVVATIAAALSGYWSIAFLLRYLRTRTTRIFVIYRLILGAAILIAVATGLIRPQL